MQDDKGKSERYAATGVSVASLSGKSRPEAVEGVRDVRARDRKRKAWANTTVSEVAR